MSDLEFSVGKTDSEGIIGTNESEMGYILIVPFQGGVLLSYAMPQADPPKALSFLKSFAVKMDGKIQ